MSSYDRLADLLPSTYRPEAGDETLLARLLAASGFVIDGAAVQLQHVLRSHWFDVADTAVWDVHYQTDRGARGLPAANVRAPADLREILQYPYVDDLARVCALLNLPPWTEPVSLRETVEEYRQRVGDIITAYRLGLTTVAALRELVEAALPEDMSASLPEQRWPFSIEEPVALVRDLQQLIVPDVEEGDLVTPLTRFDVESMLGAPVLYIQGVAESSTVAPTERPVIERFTPGQSPAGVAVAYLGTVAADQTLRLSPARRTWIAVDGALQVSAAETLTTAASDPSVHGPWAAVENTPGGAIRLATSAVDGTLWFAVEEAGNWTLHRYDGTLFSAVTNGAPTGPFSASQTRGSAVYLGSSSGLFRCDLFPAEGDSHALKPVSAVPEAVNGIAVLPDGNIACASDNGLALIDVNDALSERLLSGVAIRAVFADRDQFYLATPQALLLRDHGRWFRYDGSRLSENEPDWIELDESETGSATSPLPEVHTMAVTPDGSMWFGTAHGLARYRVADGRTTLLEAFPDVGDGLVRALRVDDRGMLWIAGDDGLFRFDGRDLLQYRFAEQRWVSLGRADTIYPDEVTASPRGQWRYDTTQNRWTRFDPGVRRYTNQALDRRTVGNVAAHLVLQTASLRADLGSFDGSTFTPNTSVPLSDLAMRVKPDETRILAGGLPMLPEGEGLWRYLQMEPSAVSPPAGRPWWSREGRLFPPPSDDAPWPGHFRSEASPWHLDGHFNDAIYSYPPSARVWMERATEPLIGVRIRLCRRVPGQAVDPAIIDRTWHLLTRAKAAGVPLQLALDGAIVKGQ